MSDSIFGEFVYCVRRCCAIFCVASVSVEYGRVSAATTFDFTQGIAGSMRPVAIAESTASFGERNRCAGRLWQSRQSIVRTLCFDGSSLKSAVLNSVTTPFVAVNRTHGITWRCGSVALYSTLFARFMCQ